MTMTEIRLMQVRAGPGGLTSAKLNIALDRGVAELRGEAARLFSCPAERLLLTRQGRLLVDGDTSLEQQGLQPGALVMVAQLPAAPPRPTLAPLELKPDQLSRLRTTIKTAVKSSSFSGAVKRLLEAENMGKLTAACPGLDTDLVAQAFITKPGLLQLCDQEALTKLAKLHPALLEAINNLAASVREEEQKTGAVAGPTQEGGSYYLDEMSDEEMEAEEGGEGGARGPAITPAQLAQALAMAASPAGVINPFQGVTGMGVGAGPPRQPVRAPAITGDMFQQAMQQALLGAGLPTGPSPGPVDTPTPSQQGELDLAGKVERMKEMGIVDEGLALQALQIMGGDLQAAVDLIFSGWEGGEDSMQ